MLICFNQEDGKKSHRILFPAKQLFKLYIIYMLFSTELKFEIDNKEFRCCACEYYKLLKCVGLSKTISKRDYTEAIMPFTGEFFYSKYIYIDLYPDF